MGGFEADHLASLLWSVGELGQVRQQLAGEGAGRGGGAGCAGQLGASPWVERRHVYLYLVLLPFQTP